jgi:hypothetical protein
MSGRRLADLLAIASATRNVIRRHIDLQLHSASRAAATSSITKAVRRDFGPSQNHAAASRQASTATQPPANEDTLLDGKDQDVFYEPSDSHSSPIAGGADDYKVPQSGDSVPVESEGPKKQYKPKAASASKSSKPLNPIQDQHVRKMSTHRSVPSETAGDTTESSKLRKNLDEEVYYDTKANLKSNEGLESDHIPQEAAQPPTPHDKLHDGLNNEYYYEREADPEDKPSRPKSVYPLHFYV